MCAYACVGRYVIVGYRRDGAIALHHSRELKACATLVRKQLCFDKQYKNGLISNFKTENSQFYDEKTVQRSTCLPCIQRCFEVENIKHLTAWFT